VIRGETTHYDYVCGECARGLQDLAVLHRVPVGFGVLTVENQEQAMARASVNKKNKGREAAEACLQMMKLRAEFGLS
jgi:6,7-dimethyl-8-ribityllumazine synthase